MRLRVFIFVLLFPVLAVSQLVSTEVNLRGNLQQLSLPADGIFDFEVAMFDSSTGGIELGLVQLDGIVVSEGRYAFPVDFGAGRFDGGPRWIEVRVREDETTGPYEVLQPRIPVRVVPYAEVAMNIAGGYVPPDQACATGEYVAGFDFDGFVICASDANAGGTVTQVDAGSGLTGGPITSTGTLAVDTSVIQVRVGESCAAGFYLKAIAEDGTVTCASDQSTEVAALEQRIGALEQMLDELPTTSATAETGVCFDSSGRLLPCPNFFVGDDIRGLWSGSRTADASLADSCSEDPIELNIIGLSSYPELASLTQRRGGVAPEVVNFGYLDIDERFLSHQYTAYGEDISFTLRFNTNDATGDWIQTNGPCFGTWSFVKVP